MLLPPHRCFQHWGFLQSDVSSGLLDDVAVLMSAQLGGEDESGAVAEALQQQVAYW